MPRRNPQLMLARALRLVAPGLLRAGMRRFDPVPREAVEQARQRAHEGGKLGD
ncbi:MAG: hypothetical protein QNK03_04920 [Myxococcota bacterium]|nr:hypothetical protein [Myxococcota bacterium]